MIKNSVKNTRINSEVLKELSRIISREIKDPRIAPMTSVLSVEAVSYSDLRAQESKSSSGWWVCVFKRR